MDNYIIGNTVNVEIPGINRYSTSYEALSYESRTIGGYLNTINVGSDKRIINISTIPVEKLAALSLENYLRTCSGFTHTVYLDILQASIDCKIEFDSEASLESNNKYIINLTLKEV